MCQRQRQCLHTRLYPIAAAIALLLSFTSEPYNTVDAASTSSSAEVADWHGQVLQLTDRPRAYHLKGFLTDAECEYLIENARPHLTNSTVIDNKTHKSIPSNVRTSAGMFFRLGEHEVARAIEARIAKVTHVPATHGEGLQVLRYVNGQQYRPHHDFFSEVSICERTDVDVLTVTQGFPEGGSGQRLATVLMYLTTPEEGGETVFPLGRPLSQGSEWSPCAREGLSLKAVKGDAVLFWALKPDGLVDRHSLHGSCPTLKVYCAVRALYGHQLAASGTCRSDRINSKGDLMLECFLRSEQPLQALAKEILHLIQQQAVLKSKAAGSSCSS